MPRFAANLTMLFTELPFMERFKAAADAGFEAVEFLFPYDHSAEEIKAELDEYDLKQVLFNMPPGYWEKGERGIAALPGREAEFADAADLAIEYARILECKRIHVMSGIVRNSVDRAGYMETYVRNLSFAARKAAGAGISLMVEPLNSRDFPGYLIGTTEDALYAIRASGEKNVKLQFDIYHAQISGGDLTRTIDENMDIIDHIQVAGVPGRHEPVNCEIDFGYLFHHLDDIGYGGWIGLEYHPLKNTLEGIDLLDKFR